MDTKEISGEQISAFADGECAESRMEMALAALREPEGKAAWEIYHQIGDVLRSDDMAVSLSPGFSARMAARLEAEPAIIVPSLADKPKAVDERTAVSATASAARSMKRWAIPGMVAAAAAAAVAFVATPQLMVALKSEQPREAAPTTVASVGRAVSVKAASSASDAEQGAVIVASVPGGVVLRDSRIDDYLLAHQRFSPSVFSTAQYARSAPFEEADSNK